jgi:hypothetical protein
MIATPPSPTSDATTRGKVQSSPRSSFFGWGWVTVLMISVYLLFNHGCHADLDDEPGLFPEIKSQSRPADAR